MMCFLGRPPTRLLALAAANPAWVRSRIALPTGKSPVTEEGSVAAFIRGLPLPPCA